MLRQLFLFGFLLINLPGIPQFDKLHSVQIDFSWFSCDSHKNIYAISGSKFLKYPKPYNSPVSYELQKEELPSFIDVGNVNEIVLYFQNSHKVILLDSSLKEIIRPFYLDELGMYEISMILASNDRGLWFYNYLKNSLVKLNKDFLPVVRSLNLNIYFQSPNTPNFIITFADKLYLNVPSNGILVLGPNGEYNTAIKIQGLLDFQVDGKIIYFYRDNIICCYNIKTQKTKKIYIPSDPGILNAYYHENQIIIFKKDGFTVYHHEISPSENE